MIERQIESPIPMPLDLVVKKALNSRSAFSADIPTPQSVTLASTCCFSSWRDRITSSRGRSVTDCMASMPFITRLMMTCCSWTRSPFVVPQLCFNFDGTLELAEQDAFLDARGWSVLDYSAELSEKDFSLTEPSPEPVGPASRLRRRYADAPAAALLPGLGTSRWALRGS